MNKRMSPKRTKRIFLREWREHRGLTGEKLAEKLDTGKDQISRWENSKRRINLDVQLVLAEALNIEPEDLFRDPATPSADALLRGAPPGTKEPSVTIDRIAADWG